MKRLVPVPNEAVEQLKKSPETGIGYQVASVKLNDGRIFDQVIASEGCIIEVRGYSEIPFKPEDVQSVTVNHKRWNFREHSDSRARLRVRVATA